MRVTVFGSTGGTGRSAIRQALDAGDKVTALARTPSALSEFADGIDVVAGDVLDPATVSRAVEGADVVISALGIGMHRHATTVYSQGTANVMSAMRSSGVSRLLVVSTSSLEPPGAFVERTVALMLHRILAKPYADMALMEAAIRSSGLEWTLVRAARLTKGPMTGKYRTAVDTKLKGCWSIAKADVAHYCLTHAKDPSTYGHTVEVAY